MQSIRKVAHLVGLCDHNPATISSLFSFDQITATGTGIHVLSCETWINKILFLRKPKINEDFNGERCVKLGFQAIIFLEDVKQVTTCAFSYEEHSLLWRVKSGIPT